MNSDDDRRRHPRFDVSGLAGVLDGFRIFETLMLSVGGMLIRLPVELALEQRVRVELPLGEETFRATARVVFLGQDLVYTQPGGAQFRIGLEFVEPEVAGEAVLSRYITRELATLEQRPDNAPA